MSEIREGVAADFRIDNAKRQARDRADAILRAVNGGMPLAQAARTGGIAASVQPIEGVRGQLGQQGAVPPPLATLFTLTEGGARVIEAPGNAGFYVVRLDNVDAGNARGNAMLIGGTRDALGQVVGNEYAEQLINAIRRRVGTSRNEQAVASLRNTLTGALRD